MSYLPEALRTIGCDRTSGAVNRMSWTPEDAACRSWFVERARLIGLDTETDRNGNQWAWWGRDLPGTAVTVGSHLDSVPDGGLWDGPLGIVAAFAAVERLIAEGLRPSRPVGIVSFMEEEGGRFGLACLGSRLMTGAKPAADALALADRDSVTLESAMMAAGHDATGVGADPDRMALIGEYVELHIEQGHLPVDGSEAHGLAEAGCALGVLTEIWPHGRWRIDVYGEPNHAGTTPLDKRHDPVLTMAEGVLEVRRVAEELGVLATVGRVRVVPGAVNAIASSASLWIDARGADADVVRRLPGEVARRLGVEVHQESWTPATPFHPDLSAAAVAAVAHVTGGPAPRLPSGAGHDAGVIAEAGIPVAMIVVRNLDGTSHAAGEHADDDDAWLGVDALVALLRARLA